MKIQVEVPEGWPLGMSDEAMEEMQMRLGWAISSTSIAVADLEDDFDRREAAKSISIEVRESKDGTEDDAEVVEGWEVVIRDRSLLIQEDEEGIVRHEMNDGTESYSETWEVS